MVPIVVATWSISAVRSSGLGSWSDAQGDEADDGFAFDFVGARDDGGFGDGGVADQHAFDFHRA